MQLENYFIQKKIGNLFFQQIYLTDIANQSIPTRKKYQKYIHEKKI